MQPTTRKKHIRRARRYANRQRGALSSDEQMIGFVDQQKQQLSTADRSIAVEIMLGWLRTGRLNFEHRATLRRFRRQLRQLRL